MTETSTPSWSRIPEEGGESKNEALGKDWSLVIRATPASHEVDQPTPWFKWRDVKAHVFWGDEEWLAYRLLQASLMLPECIEVNPRKRGGIPVIKGTRFTASQVLAEIADGRSVYQLCNAFELDQEAVTMFLRALSIYLDRPAPATSHGIISTGHGTISTGRMFE